MNKEQEAAIRERGGLSFRRDELSDLATVYSPRQATHAYQQAALDRFDLLTALDATRAELEVQWAANHDEHCANEWPHPRVETICTWPRPETLR